MGDRVHANFSVYGKVLQGRMEPILPRDLRVIHDQLNQSNENLDSVNASINGLVKTIASMDQDNAVLFGRTDHHYVTRLTHGVKLSWDLFWWLLAFGLPYISGGG